jgi:hypothetical protein
MVMDPPSKPAQDQSAVPAEGPVKEHRNSSRRQLIVVVLLGMFIVACLLGAGIYLRGTENGAPALLLPLGLTLGVILLIAVLAAYAVILNGAGLAGKDANALGLPEGSVRAVLALALLLIFAILSVFLFYQLENPPTDVSRNLTAEQIGLLPPDRVVQIDPVPSSSPATFNVSLVAANQPATQLAQQIVTVLATLVTAVAAFYFGATTVKEANAAARPGNGDPETSETREPPATGEPPATVATAEAPATRETP